MRSESEKAPESAFFSGKINKLKKSPPKGQKYAKLFIKSAEIIIRYTISTPKRYVAERREFARKPQGRQVEVIHGDKGII